MFTFEYPLFMQICKGCKRLNVECNCRGTTLVNKLIGNSKDLDATILEFNIK